MSSAEKTDFFQIILNRVQEISKEREKDYVPFCEAMMTQMEGGPCYSLTELNNWIGAWDQFLPQAVKENPTFKGKTGLSIVVKSAFQDVFNNYNKIAAEQFYATPRKAQQQTKKKSPPPKQKKNKKKQYLTQRYQDVDDEDDEAEDDDDVIDVAKYREQKKKEEAKAKKEQIKAWINSFNR